MTGRGGPSYREAKGEVFSRAPSLAEGGILTFAYRSEFFANS